MYVRLNTIYLNILLHNDISDMSRFQCMQRCCTVYINHLFTYKKSITFALKTIDFLYVNNRLMI